MVKKRIPKINYPRKIEDWYAREISRMVRQWAKGARMFLTVYLRKYVKGGTNLKLDAAEDDPNWFDRLNQNLKLMMWSIDKQTNDQDITNLATRYLHALNQFSYHNISARARAIGLDPLSNNTLLRNYVKGKIADNENLIKNVNNDFKNSLEKDIYNSITSGGGVTDIANAITKRSKMGINHARLIAADQTGTITSQLNAYRAKSAGSDKYLWRTMEDERVRPSHRKLDGKIFKYNDPDGGDDGEMPGEPIRCRCIAEPIFDE